MTIAHLGAFRATDAKEPESCVNWPPSGTHPSGSTRHRLTATDLRGKVVVVDFWTYNCINWQRTLPYVSAWAQKYKQGLA